MRYITVVQYQTRKLLPLQKRKTTKIAHTRAPNLGKVGEGVVECSFRNYNVLGSEG